MSPLSPSSCPHCGNPVPAGADSAPYCCGGCRAAHQFLLSAGLHRFYDLRGGAGVPAAADDGRPARAWLEPLLEQARATAAGGALQLTVDVQGIQCAACVWLLEQLFRRLPGGLRIAVNPGIGRLQLWFRDGEFPLQEYLDEIGRFGYRTGPARKEADAALDGLLVRFGVCALIAMNSMIFSFSFYFGLSPKDDGGVYALFAWLNWLLSIAATLVGGSVFFRGAVLALRRRVLHLDVPIALGVLLAFVGSTWSFFAGDGRAAYFDTLNIFITLMLLGRLLQRRVVSQNRLMLLQDEGAEGLSVRRLDGGGRLQVVPASRLRAGDTLLLLPGEMAAVRASLLELEPADLGTESITGEPAPRAFAPGAAVPAGAQNATRRALRLRAEEDFSASALRELLGAPAQADDASLQSPFWHKLSSLYVAGVLLLSAAALLSWWHAGPVRALEVTVAVLVVTCPCAIGLATPLAYEMAQAALRRAGVFVRRASFLDRVLRVRKIIFDKTGTLTIGDLVLEDPAALRALDEATRLALYHMTSRSGHPKSRALCRALERVLPEVPAFDPRLQISEEAGRGVTLEDGGRRLRLGSRAFALPGIEAKAGDGEGDVVLSANGAPLGTFRLREELRRGAEDEVAALRRAGLSVYLLSGDAPERVKALGARLHLPAYAVIGGVSPSEKEAFVQTIDRHDTLMVGDGLNDTLAVLAAACAGTPVVDRPTLPSRTDFYFLGGGLGPLSQVLDIARRTRRVVLRNLTMAFSYNVLAVGLALAGHMSPLLAAVAMPASSILIVLSTAAAYRRGALAAASPKIGAAGPRPSAGALPKPAVAEV